MKPRSNMAAAPVEPKPLRSNAGAHRWTLVEGSPRLCKQAADVESRLEALEHTLGLAT